MTGPRRTGPGFTLVELLVTIAIVASLAAILMPIINSGRRMAKIAATKSLLAQVENAIDRFTNDHGYYPPDTIPGSAPVKKFTEDQAWSSFPGTSNSAEALYYSLSNPYATPYSPYLELQADKEAVDSNGNNIPEITDRWGQPFHYNRKAFPSDAKMPMVFPGADLTAGYDDGEEPTHNVDSYDLWSLGPVGYSGAEWISNWK